MLPKHLPLAVPLLLSRATLASASLVARYEDDTSEEYQVRLCFAVLAIAVFTLSIAAFTTGLTAALSMPLPSSCCYQTPLSDAATFRGRACMPFFNVRALHLHLGGVWAILCFIFLIVKMGGAIPYIASFVGVMHVLLSGVYHVLIIIHKRYPDPNLAASLPVGAVASNQEEQAIPFEKAEYIVVVNPGAGEEGVMAYMYAIPEGKMAPFELTAAGAKGEKGEGDVELGGVRMCRRSSDSGSAYFHDTSSEEGDAQ